MMPPMIREMNDIDRGGLRLLTLGEINLARTLYAFTIRYNEVWIHRSSYLPFNLQKNNYAMTPNGELYFRKVLMSLTFHSRMLITIALVGSIFFYMK